MRLQVLAQERGKLSSQEQIELLIASLSDESMTVRATALRELRSVLSSRREWALGLLGDAQAEAAAPAGGAPAPAGSKGGPSSSSNGDGGRAGGGGSSSASLLSRLMGALLKCCDPEVHNMISQQAQQACAECLGMLGAVDPARVAVELQPPAPRCT